VASPVLASDPYHRSAVALWQQDDDDWTNIWGARIHESGTWGTTTVVSDRKGSARMPDVALDGSGAATAV
jgi:hypothetical protein